MTSKSTKDAMSIKAENKALKRKLKSQKIIINSLISTIKRYKAKKKNSLLENTTPSYFLEEGKDQESKQSRGAESEVTKAVCEGVEKIAAEVETACEEAEKIICIAAENKEHENEPNVSDPYINEVFDIFKQKDKRMDFKVNMTPQEFVKYCETSYEYSVMNKKIFYPKNPQKQYIVTSLNKILKYIIDNINTLTSNQVSSTLFMLNSSIGYQHKLVIAHDIVLESKKVSSVLFFLGALFNNLELEDNDALSRALKHIILHQYFIETDKYSDDQMLFFLEGIKNGLVGNKLREDIWSFVENIVECDDVFFIKSSDGIYEVNLECIRSGFAIRVLAHYLDWDYTYNNLIRGKILPKILSEATPQNQKIYLIYTLGILCMNAYRLFGNDRSVEEAFSVILGFMTGCTEVSCVVYMILKQRYEAECELWLESYEKVLLERGFSKVLLRDFLLL